MERCGSIGRYECPELARMAYFACRRGPQKCQLCHSKGPGRGPSRAPRGYPRGLLGNHQGIPRSPEDLLEYVLVLYFRVRVRVFMLGIMLGSPRLPALLARVLLITCSLCCRLEPTEVEELPGTTGLEPTDSRGEVLSISHK